MASVNLGANLQDLLSQQLALVQDALALQKEIVKLNGERGFSSLSRPRSSWVPQTPPESPRFALPPPNACNMATAPLPFQRHVASIPHKTPDLAGDDMEPPDCMLESRQNTHQIGDSLLEPLLLSEQLPSTAPASNTGTRCQSERLTYLLPDPDKMRERVEATLRGQKYNVEDYYKESGYCQMLARHDYFKYAAMVLIALNTIWIAHDADTEASYSYEGPATQAVNIMFCSFFSFEIIVRFGAFRNKWRAFKDSWFIFDSLLVLLMIWETLISPVLCWLLKLPSDGHSGSTSLLRLFRLFRLSRIARSARLLNSFPELLTLCGGILTAVRSVCAVLFLLGLLISLFGIIFTQLLAGTNIGSGAFDTVPQSINMLLTQVLCGPDADFMSSLMAFNILYYIIYLIFLFVALLTIMNMLVGILCGVVSDAREQAQEDAFEAEMDYEIGHLADVIDLNHSGTIDKNEFMEIITRADVAKSLQSLGVDIAAVADFGSFIFQECSELRYSDFRHVIAQFRGTRSATVKDIMHLKKVLCLEFGRLERRLNCDEDPWNDEVNRVAADEAWLAAAQKEAEICMGKLPRCPNGK